MSSASDRRRYDASCPIASALDTLGERWTLLILREVLPGPQRFSQLKSAIVGINATILSRRLDQMQEEGLIEVVEVKQSQAYDATAKAARLWPILLALASWGLAESEGSRGPVTPATAATAFAALDPARPPEQAIGFVLDGQRLELRPDAARPLARERARHAAPPMLEVHASAETLLDLTTGRLSLQEALAAETIRLQGEAPARAAFAARLALA